MAVILNVRICIKRARVIRPAITLVFLRSAIAFLTKMERNIMIDIALVTTASSTAIIALSSGLHAIQHWKQVLSRRKDGYEETANLYEDEDGVATVESEAKYSTCTQMGLIFLGTLAGLGFSLSVAIRSTSGGRTSSGYISDWLVFVSWVYHSVRKMSCVRTLSDISHWM